MGILKAMVKAALSGPELCDLQKELAGHLVKLFLSPTIHSAVCVEIKSSPSKKQATVCFIFGFIDFISKSKGHTPLMIHDTVKLIFEDSLNFPPSEVKEIMSIVKECPKFDTSRRYMMKGADSASKFMAKQSSPSVIRSDILAATQEA